MEQHFRAGYWKALLLASLAAMSVISPASAQEDKKGSEDLGPNVPTMQWLAGADRKDYKWDVELMSPRLTFQQRNLVQVRAYVDVAQLVGTGKHDLYFVLKVADAKGNWLPDDTHNHYPLPPDISKDNDIQFTAGFYAKPGTYTAALLLYDAEQSKGNVWRKQFEVKPPKHDPLPELDRNIPPIEFVDEVPEDALPVRSGAGFNHTRRFQYGGTDEQWPPGHGIELLPVRSSSRRPLQIDVVLNVAPWIDPFMQARPSPGSYRAEAGRMVQIGALLSHITVSTGCVRVSAVDLAKLEVVVDRVDGRQADWEKLGEKIRKHDHDTISVSVLSKQKSTAGFLRDFMTNIMVDGKGCGGAEADHAIVLVSHDFSFPSGTSGDRFWPDSKCACRYYYVRVRGANTSDDLDKFFKPANPRRFDVHSPEEFRKTIAELLDDLSSPGDRPNTRGK